MKNNQLNNSKPIATKPEVEIENYKRQIMNVSLINEMSRIFGYIRDLDSLIKTLLLGIQEIAEFDRVIFFNTNIANFCATIRSSVGVSDDKIANFSIPLGVQGGSIADAIFFGRHYTVFNPEAEDIFLNQFSSNSYIVLPFIRKAKYRCWDIIKCEKENCQAYGGYNPYCWTMHEANQCLVGLCEDDQRIKCSKCEMFLCSGAIWLDRNKNETEISTEDITNLTSMINSSAIFYENISAYNEIDQINKDLEKKNNELRESNIQLQETTKSLMRAEGTITKDKNHIFLSYVTEDFDIICKIKQEIEKSQITVWMDRYKLQPGVDWRIAIKAAIENGIFFIACFSSNYSKKLTSYMNSEINIAIEQIRKMPEDRIWFIPLKIDACEIPYFEIREGKGINSKQYIDLYKNWDEGILRIVGVINRNHNIS